MNKRGQMTMFVIIALIIVGSIVLFYVFRERFGITKIPPEFQPVFDLYESCVEQETEAAIELAGTQAGQVFMEDYIPGSEYAPSSSHLNFLGFPVPYWYYIAGNGIIKENVPSKSDIENDLAEYIESRLNNCNFDRFYEQGF